MAAAKNSKKNDSTKVASSDTSALVKWVVLLVAFYLAVHIVMRAYKIRMAAIEEYGLVIHEFDPYFNYRATEYLYEHGAKKFFSWFDYMSWYPLGRPVGTTIYPGMQFTSVWIKEFILKEWSINDICCMVPAWFGAIATLLTGLIAYECSVARNTHMTIYTILMDGINGKLTNPSYLKQKGPPLGIETPALLSTLFTMAIMAIVPAHLMRSVGGGYDNESVAMTAMTATFYCWIRSLRNDEKYSWLFSIASGLAYFYMVAAWGGYIFVLNLVGLHALALVLMGRFTPKVYISYTIFFALGTSLAIQIPVVGWSPLKSLEQLGPALVFLGYQGLQFCEVIRKKKNLSRAQAYKLRIQVAAAGLAVVLVLGYFVAPSGYFGPISSRVRGLFVKHTKTGNPLVDSVAEHQPASNKAYFQYLHNVCLVAPIGYAFVLVNLSDTSSFLLLWGAVTYFFSNRMVRLILLTAPIGSVLGGIAAGRLFGWCMKQLWGEITDTTTDSSDASNGKSSSKGGGRHGNKGSKNKKSSLSQVEKSIQNALNSTEGVIVKRVMAVAVLAGAYMLGSTFHTYSWQMSTQLSNPSIIALAKTRSGQLVKLDDYREAYWWVRDNTPEDARILAWWDYGYQITAIANRTTMADGNTWNHEHIALLGRALTTELTKGHEIARQMADYVLLWGGGGGDDLAKSPHLARIANSVYRFHCPNDPTCRAFGFVDRQGTPSPMMERSLLYQLHGHGIRPGVQVSPNLFTEVFRSKYGRVRVFKIENVDQESRKWCADPANRLCDAPGSWFCRGQYPPGLAHILSQKKDFAQLEDFNRGGDADKEYQEEYFKALNDPDRARQRAMQNEAMKKHEAKSNKKDDKKKKKQKVKQFTVGEDGNVGEIRGKLDQETKDRVYNKWEDSETTTRMFEMISHSRVEDLKQWLQSNPADAFVRSKDGRGPMWWAFESRNQEIVKLLMTHGLPTTDKDGNGKTPTEVLSNGEF